MAPTAYRKQADSRTATPISGIGQAATENSKTTRTLRRRLRRRWVPKLGWLQDV